jgi:tetratricopeptide (TPR) repeat protein
MQSLRAGRQKLVIISLSVILFSPFRGFAKDVDWESNACFSLLQSLDPDDLYTAHLVSGLYLQASRARQAGRHDLELAAFQRILQFEPDDGKAHFQVGRILYEEGRYEAAIASFREALAIKLVPVGVQYLSNSLRRLGRTEEALEEIHRAVVAYPEDTLSLLSEARLLMDVNRQLEAGENLDKLLERDPHNASVLVLKTLQQMSLGQHNAALATVHELLILDPDDKRSLTLNAQVLMALRRNADALNVVNRALDIDPKDSLSLGVKAQILRAMQRYEEALVIAKQKLQWRVEDRYGHFLMIMVLLDLGRNDEAFAFIQNISDPQERGYFASAIYMSRKEFGRADQLLATLPDSQGVLWKRAQLAYQRGDFALARDFLIRMLQITKHSNDIWGLVALLKIEEQGESLDPSQIEELVARYANGEYERLRKMAGQLPWEYVVDQRAFEEEVSITNSFWNGLNTEEVSRPRPQPKQLRGFRGTVRAGGFQSPASRSSSN